MSERRFESTDVLETVLDAAQQAECAMSSDTPRVGRGMIPKHLKHVSRGPVRESSRTRGPGARSTSGERHYSGAQDSVAEKSRLSHYVSRQAEMENCMLRGRKQSFTGDVQNLSSALHAAQSSTQSIHSRAQAHVASLFQKGQTADVEIRIFNSRIRLMETMHHAKIQDQARITNDEQRFMS